MQSETGKIALLRRLSRVRAVERKQALRQLAETRLQSDRMTELAHRTRQLAQNNSCDLGEMAAEELTATLQFRSQLSDLSNSAERMGIEAESDADRAREHFASTERSCDIVEQRIAEETRRAETFGASNLARNLLNEAVNPRRSPS